MDREGATPSLHARLLAAVERAARAQDYSHALIERQQAIVEAIADERTRHAAFGNGQSDARTRSAPG